MTRWTGEQMRQRQALIADLLSRFPDEGHRTLARKLHNEHPLLFPDIENARCALRKATGNSGTHHRREAEKRGMSRAPRKPGAMPPLPQSSCREWTPFEIPERRVLVLSDIHLPYHDVEALELALEYGDEFKPKAILINGDLFDAYQLSRFDKDPTKDKISHELECGKQFFHHLRKRYPKARIYYKLGNHDERLEQYLQLNAPMYFDIPAYRFAWHIAAGLPEHQVQVIADQRKVMLGKLMVLHGHEKGKGISSPVNPARGAFMRLLTSVLEGHSHRTSEHTERTGDGRIVACRSTGCLCGLWPEYARVNKWDNGFATVVVDPDGGYECELKRIINGKVR